MAEEGVAAHIAGAADTGTTTKTLLERIETVLDEHVRPELRGRRGCCRRRTGRGQHPASSSDGCVPGMLRVDHDAHHEGGGQPQGPCEGDPLRRGGTVTLAPAVYVNEPRWRWPRAAYIHIPFCAHKCGYCDFASLAGVDHLADRYLAALEQEVATFLPGPQEVDTIFVGGGTPTRLSAEQLSLLCSTIKNWFVLADGGEWTVEANPGTIDAEKADVLGEAGVSRISLGAQSFQPGLLAVLEREHGREQVERALDAVRPRFCALVAGSDFRGTRLNRGSVARRPGNGAIAWSGASLVLWAGLREGNAALEPEAKRAGAACERGPRATDVRGDDRAAFAGGPGDVRDLEFCACG